MQMSTEVTEVKEGTEGYLLTYCMEQSPSWEANKSLQLVKKFPAFFMEAEGSLPYSQVPATCPYPEPTLSNPHNPHQLLAIIIYFPFIGTSRSRVI
jgi:hypothetical protein